MVFADFFQDSSILPGEQVASRSGCEAGGTSGWAVLIQPARAALACMYLIRLDFTVLISGAPSAFAHFKCINEGFY